MSNVEDAGNQNILSRQVYIWKGGKTENLVGFWMDLYQVNRVYVAEVLPASAPLRHSIEHVVNC